MTSCWRGLVPLDKPDCKLWDEREEKKIGSLISLCFSRLNAESSAAIANSASI